MNIVLVGFMGTGKTTIGKLLANKFKTKYKYISTDEVIEDKERRTIQEIFKKEGEPYFRKTEKEIVAHVSELNNFIIDAGGGIMLDEDNINNLKRNGTIICLNASPEVIFERTKKYRHRRPLLNVDNPLEKIKELLDKRAIYYAKADFTIDTSNLTVDEIVLKITEIVETKK